MDIRPIVNRITLRDMSIDDVDSGLPRLTFDASDSGGSSVSNSRTDGSGCHPAGAAVCTGP